MTPETEAAMMMAAKAALDAAATKADLRADDLRKYSLDGFGPLGGWVGVATQLALEISAIDPAAVVAQMKEAEQ